MPDQSPQNIQSDEISLKELILELREWYRYLRSKWVIILIAGIIGVALGLAYSLYKKPVYTATITFALEEKSASNSLSNYSGLASQFGIDLAGGSSGIFSGDNIMELMKSRLMITKTLLSGVNINDKEQSLADFYIEIFQIPKRREKSDGKSVGISFPVNSNPDSLSFTRDSIIGSFCSQIVNNSLKIGKLEKSPSIFEVDCKSSNELFAKYFAEALVKNVSEFYIQTKTKRSVANVDILQKRIDSVRNVYYGALYGTAKNTDENLNPVRAVVSVPRIKSQSEAQILGAEYAELVKNLEIAKMTLLQETPLIQVIDKPSLPLEKTRVGKFKGMLTGGVILCCLTILAMVLRRAYKNIMNKK